MSRKRGRQSLKMWRCPECSALFYNKSEEDKYNTCDFCKKTVLSDPRLVNTVDIVRFETGGKIMKKIGQSIIRANRDDKRVSVQIFLDPKGKPLANSGILATITNEIHDVLRNHFCAHQITVLKYEEPQIMVKKKTKRRKHG